MRRGCIVEDVSITRLWIPTVDLEEVTEAVASHHVILQLFLAKTGRNLYTAERFNYDVWLSCHMSENIRLVTPNFKLQASKYEYFIFHISQIRDYHRRTNVNILRHAYQDRGRAFHFHAFVHRALTAHSLIALQGVLVQFYNGLQNHYYSVS